MNLRNKTKASDYEVRKWIEESIPELTKYQKTKIYQDEMVRFSPFYFYKDKKKVNSIWLRLSIILLPVVWLSLVVFMPINFMFTGKWGYGKKMNWFLSWIDRLGV